MRLSLVPVSLIREARLNMNEIHAEKLALATSLVVAVLYAACWGVVLALPEVAMSLTEDMLHMRMESVEWQMTPRSFLLGAVAWAIAAGGTVWLIGKLYSRLCRKVA